ncbi:MFS transporter [Niabella sp.]|uniref:MFS transporter n=1 Tax=Niabella sp. TaxID=1962976 RepID=UPI002609B3EE|nr:MFS transporter [Niabella sp.]
MQQHTAELVPLSGYQKLVIFILAITQFTVVLDFMVMSPMGDILMKSMGLTTSQFGVAVSSYAFSAGLSGLLAAGYADRFDRKKIFLFFYTGFIAGTFLCGMASSYPMLIAARIITGLFGGVIGSISMAIITDIFVLQQRGRVMGFVQMGFGASQVLGIPIGLFLANSWGWHSAFLWIAGMAVIILALVAWKLKPINKHLALQHDHSAFRHLWNTFSKRQYRIGFGTTALLSIGGFMMMPFGSAFAINNQGVTEHQLPLLFMISGISSLLIMPFIGKLSDKKDKFSIFATATVGMMLIVVVYTNLGVIPFWLVVLINILMMAGILGRMTPSTALITAVPEMQDRGAFMSINASLQQLSGGIAAAVAGMIVVQKTKTSPLEHYNVVGYVVAAISVLAIWMMFRLSNMIKQRNPKPQ